MFAFGAPGVLTLDRPVSNFDVAGETDLQSRHNYVPH